MTKPETEKLMERLAADGPPITAEHMPLAGKACAITGPVSGAWVRLSDAIEHAEALRAQGGGERCDTCDGTGSVHRADGEYMGECHCATPDAAPDAVYSDRVADLIGEARTPLIEGGTEDGLQFIDLIAIAFGDRDIGNAQEFLREAVFNALTDAHARSAGGE